MALSHVCRWHVGVFHVLFVHQNMDKEQFRKCFLVYQREFNDWLFIINLPKAIICSNFTLFVRLFPATQPYGLFLARHKRKCLSLIKIADIYKNIYKHTLIATLTLFQMHIVFRSRDYTFPASIVSTLHRKFPWVTRVFLYL